MLAHAQARGLAHLLALALALALPLPACATTHELPSPSDATPDTLAPPFPDADPPDVPPVPATEPPIIPIGLDAYRLWDRWPTLRIGARTYMRSTYDRSGYNEAADASHFIRQRNSPTGLAFVPLDVAGSGVLSFVRTNHWHGSPWHYSVDATETIVQESTTATPDKPVAGSVFIPEALFPSPLTFTWSVTKGADLSWVPIPFERSFELAYGRNFYGTGYYIYTLYAEGTPLSRPLVAWDGKTAPGADVLSLIARAGEDIAPTGAAVKTLEGTADLPASGAITLVDLADGPRQLRALRLTVPRDRADALGRARLRITWDDRAAASVDAPIALFFGTGSLYDRTAREYLVKAFPATVRFPPTSPEVVELSTYFPMPYFHHARIELVSTGEAVAGVRFHVRSEPYTRPSNHVGYFHATHRDHGDPIRGKDLVLLDTRGIEGSADWCGSMVGTSFIFSDRAVLTTLEGDPRFFFDDSQTPQAQGTGTEEWGGGGDYWGGETMTLPFAGHPVGAPSAATAKSSEDQVESAYRFLLADAMSFGRNALIQLEHGPEDNSVEHYRSVVHWYGLPGACLVQTDALHVGDDADEKKHGYLSPDASPPETVTSRYEWGVDHAAGVEIFPATSDFGRHTRGRSELSLAIDPKNFGVLLRRKLDYSFPDQRAEVWIAADAEGAAFAKAGVWYLAGANTSLFAYGPNETTLGAPVVQTSNRRFRDDEFMIPRTLTEGRSRIRVRIVPIGSTLPLTVGAPVAPMEWSEMRYTAYVWVLPPPP